MSAENLLTRRSLPFVDPDAYRFVKAATEAFVDGQLRHVRPTAVLRPPRRASLERRDVPFPSNRLESGVHRRVPRSRLPAGRPARRCRTWR